MITLSTPNANYIVASLNEAESLRAQLHVNGHKQIQIRISK